MATWVGFFEQGSIKSEMIFTSVLIDDSTGAFRAEGRDRCGIFQFEGTIQGNYFRAVKHYPSWNIYYSGTFERDKSEIYGYWGFSDGENCEIFKIMKIKNESLSGFRQVIQESKAFGRSFN